MAHNDDTVTSGRTVPSPDSGQATRRRIIGATIQCVAHHGVADTSMAAIAAVGQVSKALLHYHFADRAQLLAQAAQELGDRLITREAGTLVGVEGRRAVDAVWLWVEGELVRGELRALVELGTLRDPHIRMAVDLVRRRRRQQAALTAGELFARLGLTPRVSVELLGDAHVVFLDGLSVDGTPSADDARVSFDVFWLALLGLVDQGD